LNIKKLPARCHPRRYTSNCRIAIGCLLLTLLARSAGAASDARPPAAPEFAFWYEDWKNDTWAKLQPANIIIGVPPEALADIHAHGGRVLRYVTFYQATFGSNFLRDEADLDNVGFHTKQGFLQSAFGGKDNYVLCSNSIELSRRVMLYVDRTIRHDGYDGIFIDNAYQPPASEEVCDAKHAHGSPGSEGGPAYVNLLAQVSAWLRKEAPAATMVIVNAGNPVAVDALNNAGTSLWDVTDYVLWESYGFSSHIGIAHDRIDTTITQSKSIASSSHASKVLALAYPRNYEEAISSFAMAQIFGFQYAANLGEKDVGTGREGGHFGVFVRELPPRLGLPKSDLQQVTGTNNLQRHFETGDVMVNLDSRPWLVRASRKGVVYSKNGSSRTEQGSQIEIAPRSAAVIVFD
jgi:hypothetical protein